MRRVIGAGLFGQAHLSKGIWGLPKDRADIATYTCIKIFRVINQLLSAYSGICGKPVEEDQDMIHNMRQSPR